MYESLHLLWCFIIYWGINTEGEYARVNFKYEVYDDILKCIDSIIWTYVLL